ncbi:hypothetical protein ILYODFUR_008140 [Ilyodon furcidens]|uniref:Protein phosphatase 1 regulatory subunit 12A n=1 Tax=Ilyodon furcidens TaxID=33524 RepID=A0ABV0T9Z5_9TELE
MKMADAKQKRNEQLKRWLGSETDQEPPVLKKKKTKVKFDDGAVFLAACSSGDTEEVLRLLDRGADINYANVDGLTALHQVCASMPLFAVSVIGTVSTFRRKYPFTASNCLPWNTCQMEAILIPLFTYRTDSSFSTQRWTETISCMSFIIFCTPCTIFAEWASTLHASVFQLIPLPL